MGQNLGRDRTEASLRPICHTFQQVTRCLNRRRGIGMQLEPEQGHYHQKPTEEDVDDDDERGLAGDP